MAYVTEHHIAVHMSPHIIEYHDLNEVTLAFPWYGVSLPPGEPDDPCTHHVTIRDRDLSVTVSLTLPDRETSDRFFREVASVAREFTP